MDSWIPDEEEEQDGREDGEFVCEDAGVSKGALWWLPPLGLPPDLYLIHRDICETMPPTNGSQVAIANSYISK